MSDDNKDKPYFKEDGTLVIPFACPDHSYKYWKKEGKKLSEILKDLGADKETWKKFTTDTYPDDAPPKKETSEGE
ncbi:hypothetical protein [Maridesulfovibrio hydrothermalis]|uniref:Uncharacterized protein n=1 Tax=Maridesulfovibrio hydrothermalis AM13 = DSM 14728 TaxID=1121451 RepID=L0R979_9BACT|nr:hypothetical protein [Maridesulfovibrio hydrothermalis]CCO22136.1 conserved protein of unknown function [Maridesulfovibrio hydrothermalis AM13 = DSM 14728]